MAVQAMSEEVASRFAPYVQELRELFGMHGVTYGRAEDLRGFTARLETPGPFAEDVSSILRSIILRQGGSLPQTDLLEILAAAAAGPEVDPTSAAMQPEFRKLLSFVGVVARRPWNVPPGGELAESAAGEPAGRAGVEGVGSAGVAGEAFAASRRGAVAAGAGPAPGSVPGVSSVGSPGVGNGRGSGVVAPVARNGAPVGAAASATTGAVAAAVAKGVDGAGTRFSARAEKEESEGHAQPLPLIPAGWKSFPSSAPLWIGAVCAIALVIGVVFYSHASLAGADQRTKAEAQSITLPEPVQAAPPVPEPKPTPDIAPPTYEVKKPDVKPAPAPAPRVQGSTGAARSIATPKPVVAPAPVAAPAEPSPDAMLTAAAAAADDLPDTAAGAEGSRAALRSPIGRAGKGPYFLVSSGIMASHLLESPPPNYPMMAKLTHIQGKVILQAVISTDGQVIATRVLSGHRLLRGAAVSAVKQWRYKPYVMEGHPVNVATIVTVDFHSHN